jgi:cellobiose-specific phosphotransferase system component IIA
MKRILPVLLLGMMLVACAGVPVQEMSDARQALQAAAEVGAREKAADNYKRANELLRKAEEALKTANYAEARKLADEAKEQAIKARKQSLGSR